MKNLLFAIFITVYSLQAQATECVNCHDTCNQGEIANLACSHKICECCLNELAENQGIGVDGFQCPHCSGRTPFRSLQSHLGPHLQPAANALPSDLAARCNPLVPLMDDTSRGVCEGDYDLQDLQPYHQIQVDSILSRNGGDRYNEFKKALIEVARACEELRDRENGADILLENQALDVLEAQELFVKATIDQTNLRPYRSEIIGDQLRLSFGSFEYEECNHLEEAKNAIQEVLRGGHDVHLAPANNTIRTWQHILANVYGLESYSQYLTADRHVVIRRPAHPIY